MKYLPILLALGLSASACSGGEKRDDATATESTMDSTAREASETAPSDDGTPGPHHGDVADHHERAAIRHHRFDEPEKYAERWNDPARDGWQKPSEVVAAMQIEPGMTVADLGTGTGYFVGPLSEAVGDGGKVFALDLEQAMVDFVTERATAQGWSNVEPKKVTAISPGVSGVDRFLIVNTWHHIAERGEYAKRLAEAMAPGGKVVIVDYSPDVDLEHGPPKSIRLTPSAVVAELESGGLDAESIDETLPRQYIVVGSKR